MRACCKILVKIALFHLRESRAKPLKNNIPLGLRNLVTPQLTMCINQLHTNYGIN